MPMKNDPRELGVEEQFLYDLTGTVLKRVSDVRERLQWCPMTSKSWQTIAERLNEGAVAAAAVAVKIRAGEVR